MDDFNKDEITLTMNEDGSLTIDPSPARKLRDEEEKVRFTTNQDQVFFYIQFNGGSPLNGAEYTVSKGSPDEDTVRKEAEIRTFYYSVFAVQIIKPSKKLHKDSVRMAADAGCPSIIIR